VLGFWRGEKSGNMPIRPAVASIPSWLFLACCIAFSARAATTYYVSPGGLDTNSGQGEGAAWKTVAKVNATTFSPGDSILFERGGEWRESLKPICSGTAADPIVFGAYGAGAKPRLWGSEVLNNANFLPVAGRPLVYSYTTTFPIDRHNGLAVDHQLLPWLVGFRDAGETEAEVLDQVQSNPNGYWINDGFPDPITPTSVIYVNTNGSDPRTDGKVYTACVRQDVVLSEYKDYLTFRDLVVDETAALESGYGFRIMGGSGIRLESCEAYRVGVAHFGVIGGEVVGDQLHAAYAMPNQTYLRNAAYFSNNPGANDVQWIDCVAEHLENYPGQRNYAAVACVGSGTGSVSVQNMTCVGFGGGEIALGCSGQVSVVGGTLEDCYSEQFASDVFMDGVTFFGNKTCIDSWGNNCLYQNLLITDVDPANPTGYPAIFVMRDGVSGNTVRFCTVVLGASASNGDAILAMAGSAPNTSWYGNIMIAKQTVLYGGATASVATADYNFYNAAPTFMWGTDFATWQGSGLDVNSLTGDPGFTNAGAGDYTLAAGSEAIDAALVNAANVPATDTLEATRPAGAAADMGAYETGGAPPAPTITSAATASGTVGVAFTYQITATGSPTQYNATGLPSGLTVNTSTGLISGVPTAAGTSSVTLSATNADGTGTMDLTLTVDDAAATYTLTVTGGTGGGDYAEGTVVDISAEAPPAAQVFDRWTGDVAYVASATSAVTTVTMPAQNVALTATYTDDTSPQAEPTSWGCAPRGIGSGAAVMLLLVAAGLLGCVRAGA
jgi:hypothetical protein